MQSTEDSPKSPVRFIGVAGPAGAGKDLAAAMLCELFDAQNLSMGDVVRSITRYIYRLPIDEMPVRNQLFVIATFLRAEVNPAFLTKICIEQAKVLDIERAVISGCRSLGEAQAIQAAGGIVVGVTANSHIRYERIFTRARDSEAAKSFEEFLIQDEKENRGIDGNGIDAIIDHADVIIKNNSSSPQELKKLLQTQLTPLLSKQLL